MAILIERSWNFFGRIFSIFLYHVTYLPMNFYFSQVQKFFFYFGNLGRYGPLAHLKTLDNRNFDLTALISEKFLKNWDFDPGLFANHNNQSKMQINDWSFQLQRQIKKILVRKVKFFDRVQWHWSSTIFTFRPFQYFHSSEPFIQVNNKSSGSFSAKMGQKIEK